MPSYSFSKIVKTRHEFEVPSASSLFLSLFFTTHSTQPGGPSSLSRLVERPNSDIKGVIGRGEDTELTLLAMVYIASDGTLAETKKRKWGLSIIRELIVGFFDFVVLFFRTLTASPTALETERVSPAFLDYASPWMVYSFISHPALYITQPRLEYYDTTAE
jgi:hypothetical protein